MSDFSELISFKKDREEMRTESVYYVQLSTTDEK